jgi:micrococcal nuclease
VSDAVTGPVYRYRAVLVRVVDGDTLIVRTDLGFHAAVEVRTRLAGLNCPEAGTPEGTAATEFTRQWLDRAGPVLVIDSKKHRGNASEDDYGRWLAVVWSPAGACLNVDLLATGHAVPVK